MKNNLDYIVIIPIHIFIGLVFETFLIKLFPYSELAGLVNYPSAFFISIICGLISYFVIKNKKIFKFTKALSLIILFLQLYFQIWFIPQNRGSILKQIINYWKAYESFDKIDYNLFNNEDYAQRVAFIFKFRKILPQRFVIIYVDSLKYENSEHKIFRIDDFGNGIIKYNKNNFKILYKGDSTCIIESNEVSSSNSTYFLPSKIMLEPKGFFNESISIWVGEEKFKIDDGSEMLFYKFLESTKK